MTADITFPQATRFGKLIGDFLAPDQQDSLPDSYTSDRSTALPERTAPHEDRYQILSLLNTGGSAQIFRAHDTVFDREVVIKRFAAREDGPAGSNPDFESELSALSRLSHPNLVQAFDLGESVEGPFLVMELLQGQVLQDLLAQSLRPGMSSLQPFVLQVLEALIAMHETDLCHLDLSPANIMVSRGVNGLPHYTLFDFGRSADPARLRWRQSHESKKSILGSIYYMAPEQLTHGTIDARTDLYSLGIIIYQILTGQRPFNGGNSIQVMSAHLLHQVTPLNQLRPDLPAGLGHWVMALLALNPEVRPASAREALHSFLSLAAVNFRPLDCTGPFPAATAVA